MEDVYMDHANKYEFADITWYPSKHTAVYRYDYRVPLNVSGDGVYDFIGFQPNSILVSKSIRDIEKLQENMTDANDKCLTATTTVAYKKLVGNGLKNSGLIFTGYPVVGYQGKMQTSGSCLYSTTIDTSCAWDPKIKGLFFYERTAIFSASTFGEFVRDVKKLRGLNPQNFCGLDIYNGFLIRFVKASNAYLGQSRDSVVIDFNYYRSEDPSTPRLNRDVLEEVEQMAFFKYGVKPHWAKNRNVAFLGVQNKYGKWKEFFAAKEQLDPQNIFSSKWSDDLVYGKQRRIKLMGVRWRDCVFVLKIDIPVHKKVISADKALSTKKLEFVGTPHPPLLDAFWVYNAVTPTHIYALYISMLRM